MKKLLIISLLLLIFSIGVVAGADSELNITESEISSSNLAENDDVVSQEVDDEYLSDKAVEEIPTDEDVLSSSAADDEVLSASNEEDELSGYSIEYYLTLHDTVYMDDNRYYDVASIGYIYNSNYLGNLSISINGEEVYNQKVSRYQYIDTGDLSNLPKFGMHNVTYTYSGGYYDKFSITKMINFTYPFFMNYYKPYLADEFTFEFYLPEHATGIVNIRMNNKSYDHIQLDTLRSTKISFDEFNLGENEVVAYYPGDNYHPSSQIVTSVFVRPEFDYPTTIIDNEDAYVTVKVPRFEQGTLTLLKDITDYNDNPYHVEHEFIALAHVENGTATIKMPKFDGQPRFVLEFNGRRSQSTHFYCFSTNSTPHIKVNATSEIKEGQTAQIRVTNDYFERVAVYVEVDGQRVLDNYIFTDVMDIAIPELSLGDHKIVIHSVNHVFSIYFMKTLNITVKEKTAEVNGSNASKEIQPSVNTSVSDKTNPSSNAVKKESGKTSAKKISLSLSKVKVKKSAKKITLKATLKINGKAAKSKWIVFKFNGKTYKAKTNSKGVAKLTLKKSVLKKLKAGKKVKYQVSYSNKVVKKTSKVLK